MNRPLRFTPHLRPMVWGGRRLLEVLGKPLATDQPHGESWEISDHPAHRSVVAKGLLASQTLRQLMEKNREDLLGPAATATTFPWLIKFLDASDWLSVQVHPDDVKVKKLWPGEGGKTEAWFVYDALPGSKIYAGLLPGVEEGQLRQALREGTVAECLHCFEPRPGDCVFLPAGTVHAVGGGVLMAEIQQTSDATFRLFDWNRRDAQGKSRTLHVEEAMACIDWQRGPIDPVQVKGFLIPPGGNNPRINQRLVQCPYFSLDYLQDVSSFTLGGDGLLRAVIVIKGKGGWRSERAGEDLKVGEVLLLPASMPAVSFQPRQELGVLVATWPGK